MEEFRDRVAVVTGGASGIGRAMAERFAAEGMRLVLADVEEAALAATVAERSRRRAPPSLGVPADVSERRRRRRGARTARSSAFGAVHVVCNNAGRRRRRASSTRRSSCGSGCSASTCAASCTACTRSCRSCSSRTRATS